MGLKRSESNNYTKDEMASMIFFDQSNAFNQLIVKEMYAKRQQNRAYKFLVLNQNGVELST
jgi:hypothetical protein